MRSRSEPGRARTGEQVVAALAVAWVLTGCADTRAGGPTVAEPAPGATPAVAKPAAPAPEPEPAPTIAAAEPEPEPEPELRAPDGTVIAPCEDVPKGMACVPGGPFIRGTDDGPENTRPAETIWLQTYYMDLNEVTYAEYKACQGEKRCGRAGPLYNDFSRPNQPMVGEDWYEAVQFCEAHGKHLPTEAEWEKAARGPEGKLHPWGDEPATCERAIIMDARGRSCGVKKRMEHPDKGRTFEIGSRPPGVYGLYDMSGNAWEWVADWYSRDYESCGDACRGVNPRGPCDGAETCKGHDEKLVRGGSWYWVAKYATGAYRRPHYPGNDPFHHFGFRCAASLEEARAIARAPADAPAATDGASAGAPAADGA